MDLAIDLGLAYPPGDQLIILTAKSRINIRSIASSLQVNVGISTGSAFKRRGYFVKESVHLLRAAANIDVYKRQG